MVYSVVVSIKRHTYSDIVGGELSLFIFDFRPNSTTKWYDNRHCIHATYFHILNTDNNQKLENYEFERPFEAVDAQCSFAISGLMSMYIGWLWIMNLNFDMLMLMGISLQYNNNENIYSTMACILQPFPIERSIAHVYSLTGNCICSTDNV